MKNWITIAGILILIIAGIGYFFYWSSTQNNTSNYEAEKTSTETNTVANESSQNEQTKQAEEAQRLAEQQTQAEAQVQAQVQAQAQADQLSNTPVELEEIASFSTKIYTKDSSRQNNISITCSALNDTDVANGETFSFCNTVGRSSPSKGYKKADIFTDGEKTKGYGGGNCQVSTTLYNAVLPVPNLNVTERHEHSNKVPYIQEGKDAAVAFGSYDFKFVNNSGSTIRIKASNTKDSVNISLVKLA